MREVIDYLFEGLEVLLVLLLAGMVVMVFGNVVLRYGFNSGIDVSEEMSRYFFVWLTFIGAVVALRENAHLGVETLVRDVRPRAAAWSAWWSPTLVILLCARCSSGAPGSSTPINASMTARRSSACR